MIGTLVKKGQRYCIVGFDGANAVCYTVTDALASKSIKLKVIKNVKVEDIEPKSKIIEVFDTLSALSIMQYADDPGRELSDLPSEPEKKTRTK